MLAQTTRSEASFCSTLPLHQTNLIQPHGALLVLDKGTFEIIQASENIGDVLHTPVERILRKHLSAIISAESLREVERKSLDGTFIHKKVMSVTFLVNGGNTTYYSSIHEKDGVLLIEVEFADIIPEDRNNGNNYFEHLNEALGAIASATTVQEVCTVAAAEIKKLSGFDKVMVYSFDEEWHGTVLAQEREEGMDDYLGLKFPESDIPKPARDLYLKNAVRLIPSRDYTPVALYPAVNALTGTYTNLSNVKLRSVAQVHLEYMKNMKVASSLSARIVHKNSLWGLIVCHHRSPKYLTFQDCSFFEVLSGIISSAISSLISIEGDKLKVERNEQCSILMGRLHLHGKMPTGILRSQDLLLRFLDADGYALCWNGSLYTGGVVPDEYYLRDLVEWLKKQSFSGTTNLPRLSKTYPPAGSYADVASGILVIPVQAAKGDFIIAFRPEVVKKVQWGGNPNEVITFEANSAAYHPRNSFQIWKETVSHTSKKWETEEIEIFENFRNKVVEFVLHQKNDELQYLLEEFQFVADFIPNMIWSSDSFGKLEYFNFRWSTYSDKPVTELKDKGWLQLVHPDDVERTVVDMKAGAEARLPYETRLRIRNKAGLFRWFLLRAVPLKDNAGQIIKWYGSCTDMDEQLRITDILEQKVTERTRDLQDANAQLKQTYNELSQLVSVSSHDLQEPVRKILIFSNLIKESLDQPTSSNIALLDKIIATSTRMKSLVLSLITFMEVSDEIKFEKTDLQDLLTHVLTKTKGALEERNATIEAEVLPVIDASPTQMIKIFENLFSNSVKFAREGVPLEINITAERIDKLSFDAEAEETGRFLRIGFRDNGIGFNQQFHDLLFKIFQKLHSDSSYEGTGIGLAIVKKIIERHKGIITASSTGNAGALFTIVLPIRQS